MASATAPSSSTASLTDTEGRPLSVEVYPGNTGDATTVPGQVKKLRERFGLRRVVLVADRGMLTEKQIAQLKQYPELGWISALKGGAIRQLVEAGASGITARCESPPGFAYQREKAARTAGGLF